MRFYRVLAEFVASEKIHKFRQSVKALDGVTVVASGKDAVFKNETFIVIRLDKPITSKTKKAICNAAWDLNGGAACSVEKLAEDDVRPKWRM